MSNSEEQLFIRKALARVEKAEKFMRVKRAVSTVFLFAAVIGLMNRAPSPELKVEVTVLIGVALVVAVCTTKIMALSNKNTKDVLQAIANLPQTRV